MRRASGNWFAIIDRSAVYLSVVGGICLLAIVSIVTLGVIMRYVFGAPILGVNEIVQLTAVALVMSSLPYCTVRDGHVSVDVFDKMIGRWGRLIGDVMSRVLSGLVFAILSYRAVLKAFDALQWGDATNMLQAPIWPFYVILAAGAGLCVVVFALQIVVVLARGAR